MSTGAAIIAHDLGTTGNKATLVDETGVVVAATTVAYSTDFGSHGKAEQDPGAWWHAVAEATRTLLARVPGARERIAAVSFSGQMMGAVFLDGAGEPVRPAMIWADTRSTAQADLLIDRIGMSDGYAITGHRLNATYSLPKIMWLRDNDPDAFGRTRRVVCAKDYVAYRLTSELATDPSDASGMNAYDQRSGTWSEDILTAADLAPSLFAPIVQSTAVVGVVTADAARITGLLAGTPVVMGGGDGPMAALGTGIVDSGSGAYAYLGSSSWVSYASSAPLHDPQMRSMTFNHVVPGMFVPTATMQAGGASLQWIVEILQPEGGDYAQLLRAAAGASASADGLFFLPHLLGERSPYWNPHARAAFVGLARHHSQANLTRAVLEGIAFNLYSGLRAFTDNGARISTVQVIGGAARSDEVLSLLSDIWGMGIRRRALVDEATALGAAIVGGVGVGVFDGFQIAERLSRTTGTFSPSETAHPTYVDAHASFVDAYRRLEPWFERSPSSPGLATTGKNR
ncbi:xylulokinase [Microbacterium sp. E-13]|uniref:xylulokinase n=1 Tax=Microbacterium sp. E-13 TaxID=3404048 RepID=UPI003CEECEE3